MKKKLVLLVFLVFLAGAAPGYGGHSTYASSSDDTRLSVFTVNGVDVTGLPNIEVIDPINDPGAVLEVADFTNFAGIVATPRSSIIINNPYQSVDWNLYQQHKANLHTHTTYSDGSKAPHLRIDEYYTNGYSILSLTDHDTYNPLGPLLYPWTNLSGINSTWENRDPQALGMVAVPGVEISAGRHLVSHFNDFTGEGSGDEAYVLSQIQQRNGLAQFVHPGLYTYNNPNVLVDWYADKYKMFDCLVGMEVYNGRDFFPRDRQFWDNVLMETLPDKVIWAFANDDNHVSSTSIDFMLSWNLFVLNGLSQENVKNAYANGTFFACNKNSPLAPEPPIINSIILENEVLTVNALNYDQIIWIADGEIIANGASLNLSELKHDVKYVRAKVVKSDRLYLGRTLTQPFHFTPVASNAATSVSINGVQVNDNQLAGVTINDGDEIIVSVTSGNGLAARHYKVTAIQKTTPSLSLGDINGDGVINIIDVVLVMQHALELITLNDEQMAAADVNGDGVIDVLDVILIKRYALGLTDTLT